MGEFHTKRPAVLRSVRLVVSMDVSLLLAGNTKAHNRLSIYTTGNGLYLKCDWMRITT